MATTSPYGVERRQTIDRREENLHAKTLSVADWIAMILLIVGGVNWGLVGLLNFDFVAQLFGSMSALSRAVYVLVGLSALYTIFTATKMATRSYS
ncbi:hypothetical protein GCM10011613_20760 [Cellvibrio zantedeschiae]|uniref:DUF378 domain-containing protein n=1 Tax=Cellvibrio zantedeschiae TaxID=1237077 RepID=A0ABQ3B2T2_9GAMM|nr:DUF378 domain-containing protein [Cellvibrio zantedeschiae]GGY75110.1 hypothetical protein GCM10011613_20760 [Cellvibrio zantedeschiae]